MRYTVEEVQKILEQDEEGRFIRLIVPATADLKEIDARGKKLTDLDTADAIHIKQYAGVLYSLAYENEEA